MALSEGTKIGPYEVIGLIGQGGMGEVYQAIDTQLDRDVALKGLPDVFTNDPVLAGLAQSQRGGRSSEPAAVRRHAAEDLGAASAGRIAGDRLPLNSGEERA